MISHGGARRAAGPGDRGRPGLPVPPPRRSECGTVTGPGGPAGRAGPHSRRGPTETDIMSQELDFRNDRRTLRLGEPRAVPPGRARRRLRLVKISSSFSNFGLAGMNVHRDTSPGRPGPQAPSLTEAQAPT
jgi:hypothetical protein